MAALVELTPNLADAPEMSLVHATQDGDLAAFEELIRRYDRKVFRIAHHITQNRQDAEDVVQNTFLKAFRGLPQFEEKSRFSTWLIRIAVNESLVGVRQRRGLRVVPFDEIHEREPATPPLEIPDWNPNPEQMYSQSELRDILVKALQRLPLIYRAVFLLRDVEGFSTEETAQALNITDSAVKTRLLRARLKLRDRLDKYFRAPQAPEVVKESC
jgi:RNA polymerase sigma-70 factor, ECF subfamily